MAEYNKGSILQLLIKLKYSIMKKQLLKLSLFLFVVLFGASTLQAQALWTENGVYNISTSGLDTNLYLTINLAAQNGAPFVEWQPKIGDGDDETQLWTIIDHRTPASAGLMEITANITDIGIVTLTAVDDASHPSMTLTVKAGTPKEVEPADYTGLDQFQRRKAKVNSEGLADSGGANPSAGNNALFLRNTQGNNSRYGVIPSAAGDPFEFDGGGIDVLQYHLKQSLSVNTFGLDAFVITNPVSNQLTIKGATSKVSKLNVYSVLGNTVLSKVIDNQNGDISVNVSALSSGLYIVELNGENGERLTKKIIKQ
jgi:hypothetical protein